MRDLRSRCSTTWPAASCWWDIPAAAVAQIGKLMQKYASLPMDLADASLVLLAEHLGHGRILSTDQRDFGDYRWKNRKPFKNLQEAT